MNNFKNEKEKILKVIKDKYLYIMAYIYLFSSVLLFLIGNVRSIISIPLSILLLIALYKAIKNSPKMKVRLFENKKIMIIIVLIIGWVLLSGIGGFIWQNSWDHKFRNALFRDLVFHNWPVVQGNRALCYYFGFWLPAAIFGKFFGLTAGYAFQVIWAIIGIFTAFGLMCQYLGKVKIRNLIIFALFSGLDIVLFLIFSKPTIMQTITTILNGTHLEWATTYFQASSNTTALFWVYNQIIPFWLGMMLLLLQKNNRSIAFIYALMLLYCPFPLVGLAPVMVYFVFRKQENINEKNIFKNIYKKIKNVCTFENIVAIFLALILALFFKSNLATNKINFLSIDKNILFSFIMYFFFEYIIYLIFIYKNNKKDPILFILLITMAVYSFIKLGGGADFSMRTNFPLIFYIMLLVMSDLQNNNMNKLKKALLICILCIGAITPMTEFIRTLRNEKAILISKNFESARSGGLETIFDQEHNDCYENFVADRDSIFFKYLAKKE